jgi:hypothetical protein
MNDEYVVLIADVRESRKMGLDERYEGQLFLKSAIIQVNEDYGEHIEAPFMITRGDEFQGVLRDMRSALNTILEFERLLFPLRLRYGLGKGTIQRMGADIPIEMDGPAFHRASGALDEVKKKKQSILCRTGKEDADILINTIFTLLRAIRSRWNDITFERYWRYKELGTFKKVADLENVSTQAVWDSMQNMRVMDVLDAEKNLMLFFSHLDDDAKSAIPR